MGIEAVPGRFARDFASMYRLREGRIAERWAVRDDLGMLRQLARRNSASAAVETAPPPSRGSREGGRRLVNLYGIYRHRLSCVADVTRSRAAAC